MSHITILTCTWGSFTWGGSSGKEADSDTPTHKGPLSYKLTHDGFITDGSEGCRVGSQSDGPPTSDDSQKPTGKARLFPYDAQATLFDLYRM